LEVKSNNFLTIICKELTLQPNKRKIITLEASIPKFKLHWKNKIFEFAAVTTFFKKISLIKYCMYIRTTQHYLLLKKIQLCTHKIVRAVFESEQG